MRYPAARNLAKELGSQNSRHGVNVVRKCKVHQPQVSRGRLAAYSEAGEDNMLTKVLLIPIVWLLKSFMYWGIFRFRTISATVLNCLIIAGAPLLLSIIPLPSFLSFPASIGVAVYFTMRYTGVELIPDGLFIPVAVELAFWIALQIVQESGILM
jgi:hypothetical protein